MAAPTTAWHSLFRVNAMKSLGTLLVLTVLAARPSVAGTPPAGFQDTILFGVTEPTGLAYEPGSGNAFVLERGDGSGGARVRRRALVGGAVTTALSLTCVDTSGERGHRVGDGGRWCRVAFCLAETR